MPTIREIASAACVSESTVSIVLKGQAQTRKISEDTQRRVLDAAKTLGYLPNISARRLRARPSENVMIALFWAADFRASMMVRFLKGLRTAILNSERKCEIIIHPYENDQLHESLSYLGMCNAVIVCNASENDMNFLGRCSIPVPIVLYNRHSEKFCTVNVDDVKLGKVPAEIFAARNHKNAVILTSDSVFHGMDVRNESFIYAAERLGMTVETIHGENSMPGGYEGGMTICARQPLPDCVFCASDAMAIGALRAFSKSGIRIPEDIEIICIGNGEKEQEEYANVSLSVMHLPMENMAEACLQMAFDLLSGTIQAPDCIELPVVYRARESCGDIEKDSLL